MVQIKEIIDNKDGTQIMVLNGYIESEYGASCLICGKTVKVHWYDSSPKICGECKEAIAWAKEQMKEKE